jgi:hypothetical protein
MRLPPAGKTGSDFLPHYLQRVAAISCVLRRTQRDGSAVFHVGSLGTLEDGEATLIQKFYELIARYSPQLVSWNGGGFDLPVLHYRGLVHGVSAPRYWEMGEGRDDDSRDFKWNNYISRYHMRHLDLMDLLAMYQPRERAARRSGEAVRIPRQDGDGRQQGLGSLSGGKAERDPRLLRDRCRQHVPDVLPLSAHARWPDAARVRYGGGTGPGDAGRASGEQWMEYLRAFRLQPMSPESEDDDDLQTDRQVDRLMVRCIGLAIDLAPAHVPEQIVRHEYEVTGEGWLRPLFLVEQCAGGRVRLPRMHMDPCVVPIRRDAAIGSAMRR